MTESILDRLDRDPGGARRYVAHLHVVGAATRAQIATALAKKYVIKAPTPRSVTTWLSKDPALVMLIRELEEIKREMSPDDDLGDVLAKLPPEENKAAIDADLWMFRDEFPAFGALLQREAERGGPDDVELVWGMPVAPADAVTDDDAEDESLAVLTAEYPSDEAFEVECERRLGEDYEQVDPTPGAGTLGTD